mgnify:FL=1
MTPRDNNIILATVLLAVLLALFGCARNPKVQWVGLDKSVKASVQYHAKATKTVTATVSWNASSNATGYKVYHTPDLTSPMSVVGETASTNMTFANLPWARGYFRVTATNIYGESQ